MWRPGNWIELLDNIRFHHGDSVEDKTGILEFHHSRLVEAGADAGIGALMKFIEDNYKDKHGNIYIDFVEWGKLIENE